MATNLKFAAKASPQNFKSALNKLGSDAAFRAQVSADPAVLTNSFNLSLKELHALRQAALLSGADMKNVDKVRADAISHMVAGGHNPAADDINVSCCCCCCCGETAVVRHAH